MASSRAGDGNIIDIPGTSWLPEIKEELKQNKNAKQKPVMRVCQLKDSQCSKMEQYEPVSPYWLKKEWLNKYISGGEETNVPCGVIPNHFCNYAILGEESLTSHSVCDVHSDFFQRVWQQREKKSNFSGETWGKHCHRRSSPYPQSGW